jgi:hypothetical protein
MIDGLVGCRSAKFSDRAVTIEFPKVCFPTVSDVDVGKNLCGPWTRD